MNVFKIYWTDENGHPHAQDRDKLTDALALTDKQRKAGMRFVTMVSESAQSVGKPGVSAVEDGMLPDGSQYDWSKAGRAGKPRKGDRITPVKNSN